MSKVAQPTDAEIKQKQKDIIKFVINKDIDSLSKITDIGKILEVMYKYSKFKNVVDKRFTNNDALLKQIQEHIEREELELLAEEEEKEAMTKDKKTHPQFYKKLTEMEAKLPPILGEFDDEEKLSHAKAVADKEFCYKFLYCWLNNPINQTNESIKQVYNDIINSYNVTDKRFPSFKNLPLSMDDYNITFDVGFIINIITHVKKGGLTPTQKRRPNKSKKRNHTIKKDRVKTR